MGETDGVPADEAWSLEHAVSDTPWIVCVSLTSLVVLAFVLLNGFDRFDSTYALLLVLSPLPFCFLGLAVLAWNGRVYHDFAFMSHREVPADIRMVETAIGLLLASREARFDKGIQTYRMRTRRQVVYYCYDMDDTRMDVLVREAGGAMGGEWTQVCLLHDIEEEEGRRDLQRAVERAIENPFELKVKRYHREERPELHVMEG